MNIVGYLFILLISSLLCSCSSIGIIRGSLFSGDNNVAQQASEKENKPLIIDAEKKSLQRNSEIGGEQVVGNKTEATSDKSLFDYIIGGKDVLYVTVYDEPDISYDQNNHRSLRVSIDGTISFPLLDNVKAAGLTPFELENKLEKMLSEGYLINPHVSVSVAEYHSKEVYVLGAVHNPGIYPLLGKESILEVISKAGGIITGEYEGKAGNDIIVMRKNISPNNEISQKSLLTNASAVLKTNTPIDTEVEYIRLDLQKLLRKGDISLNIGLQDQDTLYIPMAESVFVFGQVAKPGAIKLLEKDITVIEAISMTGGFTSIASPSRTRIVRMENGMEKTIYVNVNKVVKGKKSNDIILKPGDIVVVPEAFF